MLKLDIRITACLVFLALGLSQEFALAATHDEESEALAHESLGLSSDPALDIAITLGAGSAWIGSEVAKNHFAVERCRWCDSNFFDDAVRRGFKWSDPLIADRLSGLTGFVIMPAFALGSVSWAALKSGERQHAFQDSLTVLEATALTQLLNQSVKFAVARQRPYVHALGNGQQPSFESNPDQNLSFYSGHTSLVFALASSAGTVASARGYASAPWIWSGGIAVATTTAYLRIAADRHYATDVLIGAMLGTLGGIGSVSIFHLQSNPSTSVIPTPAGPMFAVRWDW